MAGRERVGWQQQMPTTVKWLTFEENRFTDEVFVGVEGGFP